MENGEHFTRGRSKYENYKRYRLNIILVGAMGAGKTTIGRKLAVRLGYRFIDTDFQIELEYGLRVTEIFEQQGEKYFRGLETDLLKRLANVENTVIATGGGLLTTPENFEIICSLGTSVYLKAKIEDIFERVSRNNKRPLLQTENPMQTIIELVSAREKLYAKADLTIDTDLLRMREIATKIIEAL